MVRLPRLEPQICCAQLSSSLSVLSPSILLCSSRLQRDHPSHFCVLGFCTVRVLWDGDPVPSWAPCPLSQSDLPLTNVFLPWAPGPGPEIKSLVRIDG